MENDSRGTSGNDSGSYLYESYLRIVQSLGSAAGKRYLDGLSPELRRSITELPQKKSRSGWDEMDYY